MDEVQPNGVVVVVVPLPAQGHLNQLLHLTRILSTRGLPVHYVGSATHNRQAKDRVHGWDPSTVSNLHFHDFQLPQFITPPADPNDSNKCPKHLLPTFIANLHLREPLGALLRSLAASYRRVVVVHDYMTAFAAEEASLVCNSEAYSFVSCSAFTILQFIWQIDQGEKSLFPADTPRVFFEDCISKEFTEYSDINSQYLKFCAGDLYNTCDAIEGRFIKLVAQLNQDKKLWAIGPFNPVVIDPTQGPRHHCLEWLDKQPPHSVIYVSFGTMTSISNDQIFELAMALERSEQRFIWVLREADRGDIYNGEARKVEVPEGFEERVRGVGMIVRDWAPQVQILAHSSTGGFMSHCGWNSSMESLSMGVPIAAWPMHSDQPCNGFLITEVLKVGVLVREWSRRKEVVGSNSIESCIRKLMVSEEGNMMRKRGEKLGIEIRRGDSDGGSSATQLEAFLAHISR